MPSSVASPVEPGKYCRIERERRFLLAAPPDPGEAATARHIVDRYLTGTRLRVRKTDDLRTGAAQFKLGQKLPVRPARHDACLLTNIYLSRAEYEILDQLPGPAIAKTRLGFPPLVIDVFELALAGLVLAEAEFPDDDTMTAFQRPALSVAEVTTDPRFTGGQLVSTPRGQLLSWLAEYGLAVT